VQYVYKTVFKTSVDSHRNQNIYMLTRNMRGLFESMRTEIFAMLLFAYDDGKNNIVRKQHNSQINCSNNIRCLKNLNKTYLKTYRVFRCYDHAKRSFL